MKGNGWAIIIGGILMGVATLLHPIIINPWSVLKVLPKTVMTFWLWVHVLMLLGISLWLIGLACVKPTMRLTSPLTSAAVILKITAFTIWVMVLTMELGVFPPLGRDVITTSSNSLASLWSVLFSYGLLSGYCAMLLAYLGILFLAFNLGGLEGFAPLKIWGVLSGIIGAAGILLTLLKIQWGLWILAVTTLPPFLWSLCLGIFLIRQAPYKNPVESGIFKN